MSTGQQMNMKDIFTQCQNSMQGHAKLLKSLQQLYKETDFVEFWSEFQHYMKYSMIVFKREPAVERTVEFLAKFVTSVNPDVTEEDVDPNNSSQTDEVAQNQLLKAMFDFLLASHSARDKAVRFRCCQMINKLLSNLGENAQIDDDLYDSIYESMLERLRDKFPVVRLHAVMALSRLQDPRDENCPVIKAYLFLISCDPNPDVRCAVLSCIAPSTKTLPAILRRTRDVKDIVRKRAFCVMGEKVHIKALSIAHRVQLLQDGLTDRTDSVKDTCASKLLQAWLRTFQGNVLDLLTALDVESATKTCELTLKTLLKSSPTAELVTKFDLLDENILIPVEKLTCESVMYWQTLCKYIYDMGAEGDVELEKVLPNCVEYCKYTSKFVESLKSCEDLDQLVEKEFILQELLLLIDYMDLADVASRKAVEKLFHDMLIADHVGHTMIKCIVPKLCEIRDNSDAVITYIAEMVSEIREPITTIEKGIDQEEKRQNDIKIAGIRVKLNQAKEELEECIQNQDFSKAAELKTSILELESERNALLQAGESQLEEIRTEKTDVATILKCQTMVTEMLQSLTISSLNPTLQMLAETLILPGIQNEDAGIRTAATKSLGMCCLLNKDLVMQHLPLFMQASQIDVEVVRSAALMVIFDLLHMHGLEAINNNPVESEKEDGTSTSEGLSETGVCPSPCPNTTIQQEKDDERVNTASNLVAIISDFLDSESSELRTIAAEGMAKLLLSGRVVSSKIFSHLLLLWYNPVTEDDTHLRHCLGTFFPLFAFACRSNQETVEEAFLPTLKTLMNAPLSSPLAEVNEENVAELLVQLTNIRLLLENQTIKENITENPSHANISVKVCNEILSNPDSFNLKLWVKILNQLEICSGEESAIKELLVLVDQIIVVIKDKQCLRSIEKFQALLRSMVPESSDDSADDTQESSQQTAESEDRPGETVKETATDKTVLDDSAEIDTSSFFQETRVIRRATARSERSMSMLSDKSSIFETSQSDVPRRKWSQSSESSTPEKKVVSPTIILSPEIKLPPQRKQSPESKKTPGKKQNHEKNAQGKQTQDTKKPSTNTPVAGTKKKAISRTKLSGKSTFGNDGTLEIASSPEKSQENVISEKSQTDDKPRETAKASDKKQTESKSADSTEESLNTDTIENTEVAAKESRTGQTPSRSQSENKSPKKSNASSDKKIEVKEPEKTMLTGRSKAMKSKSGSEVSASIKSPARTIVVGSSSPRKSKSEDEKSTKSGVKGKKTPSRPQSGSDSSSPQKSKSSERAAKAKSTASTIMAKKTPNRSKSSQSGSESSSPRVSRSSESPAKAKSTASTVTAKKTPNRSKSSQSGSESSSPRISRSSERPAKAKSTASTVTAKKTPNRSRSSQSGSESSSPQKSKSSERTAKAKSTASTVTAKKTPSRSRSSQSGSESSSPGISRSSERSAKAKSTASTVTAKKTPNRSRSSQSGSESSSPQRSKSSERAAKAKSTASTVTAKKTPNRSRSSQSGSESSSSQRSKSSERAAKAKSTASTVTAKKTPNRSKSSQSGSESSSPRISRSSERTAKAKSTALTTVTAKKTPSRSRSSQSGSESSSPRRSRSRSTSKIASDSSSPRKSAEKNQSGDTEGNRKSSRSSVLTDSDLLMSSPPEKIRPSRNSTGASKDKEKIENSETGQVNRRTTSTRSKVADDKTPAKTRAVKKPTKDQTKEKSSRITPLVERKATHSKLTEKSLSSENKAEEKASTSGSRKTTTRSTNRISKKTVSPQKATASVATKTPTIDPGTKTTRSATKATGKNTRSQEMLDDSDLENSVFASPTPVQSSTRSLRAKTVDTPKKNLNEALKKTKDSTAATRSSSKRSTRR